MKIVQKGNVQKKINDELLENYLNDGYSEVVVEKGKVTLKGKDTEDPAELKKEIKRLEKENTAFKAQLGAKQE